MKAWEKNIRKVIPYIPGEQPQKTGIIKLNTNENPYPPSKEVEKMWREMETEIEKLRLYPDPQAKVLVNALAENYEVSPEQIFVGVGSDDVLAMSFLTFFNSEKPILFPDITYSFYDVWADLFHIPYKKMKLDENFHIRREDYYQENGGIIFPNPNAPTGIEEELELIEDILKKNPDVIVIIDEAYVDFGAKSAKTLLEKYENLLVVQTFSKSRSMAGVRIGYAMGNTALIKALQDVKYSYNSYTMNMPSILLGTKALQDKDYFEMTRKKIIQTREKSKEELRKMGFSFPDSKTNFIFAVHEKYEAKDIFEYLKKKDIYVRYFPIERIYNYLRITIGTEEQMEALFRALSEFQKERE